MPADILSLLPSDGTKILLVLFLSFLVGAQREERKATADHYMFGGVRTYPLIGLIGYAITLISGGQPLAIAVGFLGVSGFLLVSYRHKISSAELAGATSEMSGLLTYLIGSLVQYDHFWIATTLVVLSLLLLELKAGLERLAHKVAADEILTFAKFLMLTAVILPVLPDQGIGPFAINPFRTWLVVVGVSGLSYLSYVVQKATQGRGGMVLVGLLGGIYSSTMTTVVLARRSRLEVHRPHLFAGSMVVASGMMYLRLAFLLAVFNLSLFALLARPFVTLAAAGILGGYLWTRLPDEMSEQVERRYLPKNPLELGAALLFGLLFVVMVVATRLAVSYLGSAGVYALGAVMGVADVDPFILGMTHTAGTVTPLGVAAGAVIIATASNNVMKGIYAYSFADRRAGRQGLFALIVLALAGLIPLAWL